LVDWVRSLKKSNRGKKKPPTICTLVTTVTRNNWRPNVVVLHRAEVAEEAEEAEVDPVHPGAHGAQGHP